MSHPAPTTHSLCWWCARQLGMKFTSVEKGEANLKVHFWCWSEARKAIEGAPLVFVDNLPIGSGR